MPNDIRQLELLLAFTDWANEHGYDLKRSDNDAAFVLLETQAAWLGFEAAHGPAGCRPVGQQLYAQIKKTSEYAHQSDAIFPVRVGNPPYDDYDVRGGPGGVYRLRDLAFFVIEDGKKYRLK